MLLLIVFVVLVFAAFVVGVMAGPSVHAMIKTCQDEVVNSGEGRGSLGNCFPTDTKTDLKYDPLIAQGDYWDTAPKKKSKRKGKRKGK